MARAIWSGVLTFGLVSVPVELYSATEAHGPVFHQFEKGTADRIRYQQPAWPGQADPAGAAHGPPADRVNDRPVAAIGLP